MLMKLPELVAVDLNLLGEGVSQPTEPSYVDIVPTVDHVPRGLATASEVGEPDPGRPQEHAPLSPDQIGPQEPDRPKAPASGEIVVPDTEQQARLTLRARRVAEIGDHDRLQQCELWIGVADGAQFL